MKIKTKLFFSATVLLLSTSVLSFANAYYSNGLLRAQIDSTVLGDSALEVPAVRRMIQQELSKGVKGVTHNYPVSSNSQVLRVGEIYAKIVHGGEVHGGLASVVLGTDAGGDYIKVPAFLRFILGGSDKIRFMPDGRIGVGVFDPQAGLHINHLGTLPASIQLTDGALTGTTATDGSSMYLSGNNLYFQNNEDTGQIQLLTRNGITVVKGLTVNSNGNVGIGTTNPTEKLHIKSDNYANIYLQTKYGAGVSIESQTGGGAFVVDSNGVGISANSSSTKGGYLYFITNNPSKNEVGIRMAIDQDGNVVINKKLNVVGGFCLPDGTSLYNKKCFLAVCPATNGQWTLSETATCGGGGGTTMAPAISVAIDPSTPYARQLVMGSTDNTIAKFKITETTNQEDVKITSLSLFDNIGTGGGTIPNIKASFYNLSIYNGSQIVAGPLNLNIADSNNYEVVFNPATPIVVPKNGSVMLTLKGNIATYTSNGATDNSVHVFKIADSNHITAIGKDSNLSAQVRFSASPNSPIANQVTILRSKLTLTGSELGVVFSRVRTTVDNVATLTFTADPAGDVNINKIKIKFQGSAVANGTNIRKVRLLRGGTDWNGLPSSGSSCVTDVTNSCVVIFDMTQDTAPTTISAGSSATVTLQLDSSNFPNSTSPVDRLRLSITINSAGNVDWGDVALPGIANTTFSGLSLENAVVPFAVSNIAYE